MSYITLDGNIGAGKSTLISFLKAEGLSVVYEPHIHPDNQNILLELFYSDPKRWSYTFQTHVLSARLQECEKIDKEKFSIFERSLYADYCFGQIQYELGNMTNLEWHLYQELFKWLLTLLSSKPKGFIYLQTDPDICFKRIAKRGRMGETAISKEYITMLHEKHENLFIHRLNSDPYLSTVPLLVLDGAGDFEKDLQIRQQYIDAIKKFSHEVMIMEQKSFFTPKLHESQL